MTRSIFASFLLFVTLLVGLTSSNAQGTGTGVAVNGSAIVQFNVTGGIVCNPFGNPILGPLNAPLVGVNVTLSCDGGQSTIAQVVTNNMGFFQLTLNVSNLNLLNITRCRVIVPLPVNATCIFLPSFGSLQASLTLTSIFQTVAGIIVNFVTSAFVFVPL